MSVQPSSINAYQSRESQVPPIGTQHAPNNQPAVNNSTIARHPEAPQNRQTREIKLGCCTKFWYSLVYILTLGLCDLFPKFARSSEPQRVEETNRNDQTQPQQYNVENSSTAAFTLERRQPATTEQPRQTIQTSSVISPLDEDQDVLIELARLNGAPEELIQKIRALSAPQVEFVNSQIHSFRQAVAMRSAGVYVTGIFSINYKSPSIVAYKIQGDDRLHNDGIHFGHQETSVNIDGRREFLPISIETWHHIINGYVLKNMKTQIFGYKVASLGWYVLFRPRTGPIDDSESGGGYIKTITGTFPPNTNWVIKSDGTCGAPNDEELS